ncbi:MAG: helix-hairpin-helix domain-containing protein [Tatlockia sp.]|jgi:competence protein ComEA
MKAPLFAAVMLSLSVCLPAQATDNPSQAPATIQQTTEKINLNQADARMLTQSIKGIGKKRAEAIVKYREEHGNFTALEDLAKVKGLGEQFVKNHLSQMQQVFAIN